jgi:hypothetical protein
MQRFIPSAMAVLGVAAAGARAYALPVDPAQQPVTIFQEGTDYTLAYDDTNRSVIYYAPKYGRVASVGEKPLLGYVELPNFEAYLNAQFEYGVFGASKERIVQAIQNAGYTPVAFPYRRAKLVPQMIDFEENTGTFCSQEMDPATGEMITACSDIYESIKYSKNGPTLGENLFVVAHFSVLGAAMMEGILRDGGDFVVRIDAEYYKSGRMFEAKVRVDFSRLYQNYQRVSTGGLLWGKSRREFIENETLCLHKPPGRKDECGVFIEYTDLVTGKKVSTPTIDPENQEQHAQVIQAAERLYKQLWDELFAGVSEPVAWLGAPPQPLFGSRVRRSSFVKYQEIVKEYTFRSPQSINVGTTEMPAVVQCLRRNENGLIERDMRYPCDTYWQN